MTDTIHPLLLCGGAGTRLWPLSRKSYPKQFARLTGDASLFQVLAQRPQAAGCRRGVARHDDVHARGQGARG